MPLALNAVSESAVFERRHGFSVGGGRRQRGAGDVNGCSCSPHGSPNPTVAGTVYNGMTRNTTERSRRAQGAASVIGRGVSRLIRPHGLLAELARAALLRRAGTLVNQAVGRPHPAVSSGLNLAPAVRCTMKVTAPSYDTTPRCGP